MEKHTMYLQYSIAVDTIAESEILLALLAEMGLEGFEENEGSLVASGAVASFDSQEVEHLLNAKGLTFSKKEVANQNWNAIWESSFEPVLIENFAGIRASFHAPLLQVAHELIITPKMSFGTGHHATTWLMIKQMSVIDFTQKTVLDFGTGTGVLAILARRLGAKKVVAIDNDEWSIENAMENIVHNATPDIDLRLLEQPPIEDPFDVLLANINKHVIVAQCAMMAQATAPNGQWILSGLLVADEPEIKASAMAVGMQYISTMERGGWISLIFQNSAHPC